MTEQNITATGKRKTSVARVAMVPGTGAITVNEKPLADYFTEKHLQDVVQKPFIVVEKQGAFDVRVKVFGGGRNSQAEGVAHAIAKALRIFDEESYKGALRRAGLLTRDSRIKERKKPGLRRARRAPQWGKR